MTALPDVYAEALDPRNWTEPEGGEIEYDRSDDCDEPDEDESEDDHATEDHG